METTEPGSGLRPPAPGNRPGDFRSILEELRALVSTFADASPEGMTPHFYVHAFNEYDVAVRALLEALPDGFVEGSGSGGRQSRWLGC